MRVCVCVCVCVCRPVVAVLDVEEEEGPGHQHAQDGDGGQDAVQRHADVPPLQAHKGAVLGRLHPYSTKQQSVSDCV